MEHLNMFFRHTFPAYKNHLDAVLDGFGGFSYMSSGNKRAHDCMATLALILKQEGFLKAM